MSVKTGAIAGLALLLAGAVSACGGAGGLEGRYYNARTGEFALELRGGKVVEGQGMQPGEMIYEVRGDTVWVVPTPGSSDGLPFIREANGDLSLGILGSLTRNRPE